MTTQTSIGANDGRIQTTVVGSTTGPFTVDFPFFSLDEVVVTWLANGIETATVYVRGVDYTLAATANNDGIYPSGTVTLTVAVAAGVLTRYRNTGKTRVSQLPLTGYLDRTALNADLNRFAVILQDLDRIGSSAIRFPEEDGSTTAKILPPQNQAPNTSLFFDANGVPYYGTLEALTGTTVSTWAKTLVDDVSNTAARATLFTGLLTAIGDTLYASAAGVLARLGIGSTGQVMTVAGGLPSWATPATPLTYGFTLERQTVQLGPTTATGLPSFLPATAASLNLTTQNISSSYPLVASSANGASTQGAVNDIGVSTANLTFSGLTLNRAAATPNYLYVTVVSGALTPAASLLAPIYQWGGTPSVTNDQFTYNIDEGRMYRGNGSTATQWSAVFVGEAATNATTVISTVAYAYNGRYSGAFTATIPVVGGLTTANHNLGVKPVVANYTIECTTVDCGYAVGDQLNGDSISTYDSYGIASNLCISVTEKTVGLTISDNPTPVQILNKTTGVRVVPTAASWKYKFSAFRGLN